MDKEIKIIEIIEDVLSQYEKDLSDTHFNRNVVTDKEGYMAWCEGATEALRHTKKRIKDELPTK